MRIDEEDESGEARDAVLSFKGMPVLPLPRLSFPLSDKRRSGFLPPTFGLDSVSGFEYAQPYYWNIAPNRDATITPPCSRAAVWMWAANSAIWSATTAASSPPA